MEKNEQLMEKLKCLAVNKAMWKALNPLFFTPGFIIAEAGSGNAHGCPESVRAGLRALEVRFHSQW